MNFCSYIDFCDSGNLSFSFVIFKQMPAVVLVANDCVDKFGHLAQLSIRIGDVAEYPDVIGADRIDIRRSLTK